MKQTLNRLTPTFPLLGLLLITAGLGALFVTRRWELLTNLLLGAGALLLLLYILLRPGDVRRLLGGRQVRYGLTTMLSILFFTAIVALVYFITYQNSDWRYDATEEDVFTPLPETINILESLDAPVHVIGFYTLQLAFQEEQARSQLESMQIYTDQLTYEFVDPEENPLLAEQYDLTFNGTLVFTRGEGAEQVFAKASAPVDDRSIHTALLKVINPVNKKAYFLTGHGERDIESLAPEEMETAVRLLRETGFEVETLNLFVTGEVPADATVVALVDQRAPLQPEEVTLIRDYLQNGGTAFIARDALEDEGRARAEEDDLQAALQMDWGLTFRPDFVIEQVLAQAGQSFGLVFLGAEYGASTITEELSQFGTVFNVARSLDATAVESVQQINLVTTSDQAWGETDFTALASGFAEPGEEDASGPLTIGLSAENAETGGRLVAFGDTDFMSNALILQNGNSLLVTNAFNWLADDEISVELTPRENVVRQLTVTQSQLAFIQLVSLFLAPLLVALTGLTVWYTRRQRR